MKLTNFFKIFGTVFLLVVFFEGITVVVLIGNNRSDARVINYTGYVRGATQRLVKLQIVGREAEAQKLSADLDELLVGLIRGNRALGLPVATDPDYIRQIQRVSNAWQVLKQKIIDSKNNPLLRDGLIETSEADFIIADQAVLAAEAYSENKIKSAEFAQLVFLILELVVVIFLGVALYRKLNAEDVVVNELEKFKAAVDGASDHIIITDKEGTVVYANNSVELVTGYAVSEVVGKKAGQLWGHYMPKEFYEKMWKTIKFDKQVFRGMLRNKRKNGEMYDVAIGISPIFDKKGEAAFFVGIERDITKDIALDRSKTEFVSLASHQLRTPLTAVSWYTELLLNGDAGKLAKKQEDYLGEISSGTHRMIELVNSLLDVSRMELGTFEVNSEIADVCGILDSVIKELKSVILRSKIDLNYNCSVEIPKLAVDIKLTGFIFQNILSNAIKYSREHGVVRVDVRVKDKDILVSVADNGLGIPAKQQGEIFKKFFRADNVRIKDTEGTGLGLYLVKIILGSIGGEVWFESEENVGSTFYVSIPLSGMKSKKGEKSIIKV